MVNKLGKGRIFVIISILFLFIGLTSAITFQQIFPTTNPFITSDDTVNLSYGIDASDGLSSITHSWNGTNTTFDYSSLVGWWAFNNFSSLGETTNDSGNCSVFDNSYKYRYKYFTSRMFSCCN